MVDKENKKPQAPVVKKPVFTPPNQIKFNQFGKGTGAKFNPATFKTQHKG